MNSPFMKEETEDLLNTNNNNNIRTSKLSKNSNTNNNSAALLNHRDDDVFTNQEHQFHRNSKFSDFNINNNNNDGNEENKEEEEEDETGDGPKEMVPYSSMFCFTTNDKIRKMCHYIVNWPYFDTTIIVMIILSSITLASEDPINVDSNMNAVLGYFDYIFTAVFTFEMLFKMIDLGLVLHPGSYFRSVWNLQKGF